MFQYLRSELSNGWAGADRGWERGGLSQGEALLVARRPGDGQQCRLGSSLHLPNDPHHHLHLPDRLQMGRWKGRLISQVSQSVSQSVNQPINQSVSQSINRFISKQKHCIAYK